MPQVFTVGSRSRFVTATAWAFMLLALLVAVAAPLQSAGAAWLIGGALLLATCMLASALGLWLRLEWARRLFVALLLSVMLAGVLGLALGLGLLQAPLLSLAWAALPTLGLVGLLGWIAWRLGRPLVRQEFA